MKKEEEERCCGNCCWFYGEDTDGFGFCAIRKGELTEYMHCGDICNDANGNIFVSRQQMRHHMAVLLQQNRFLKNKGEVVIYRPPKKKDLDEAIAFAYKYMKVFSKL